MPVVFNPQGHPVIPVKVFGAFRNSPVEMNAIIDTGFSGFLSLPLVYAMQAALILQSTAMYTLADGSTDTTLLCLGTVIIEDENVVGLISVSKGNDVLIGIDLLKKMKKKFVLDFTKNAVGFFPPNQTV